MDDTVSIAKQRLAALEAQLRQREQPSRTAHLRGEAAQAIAKGAPASSEGRFTPWPTTPPGEPRLDPAAEREAAAKRLVALSKEHAAAVDDRERQELVDQMVRNQVKIDALEALLGKLPVNKSRGRTIQLRKTRDSALLQEGAQAFANAHLGRAVVKDRGTSNSTEAASVARVWGVLKANHGWSDADCRRANCMALISMGVIPADEQMAAQPGSEITPEDVRTAKSEGWVS